MHVSTQIEARALRKALCLSHSALEVLFHPPLKKYPAITSALSWTVLMTQILVSLVCLSAMTAGAPKPGCTELCHPICTLSNFKNTGPHLLGMKHTKLGCNRCLIRYQTLSKWILLIWMKTFGASKVKLTGLMHGSKESYQFN